MKIADFFESLIDGEKTILHFSAVWCTPCRLMEPSMAAFLGDNPTVRYIKMDVDDNESSEMMREFAVRSVPTIISFDGRSKIKTEVRAINRSDIEDLWNSPSSVVLDLNFE